jgi:prophage regulatory protein
MVTQPDRDGRTDSLRIVRNAQVRTKLDVSEAKLFDMIAKGLFPAPFQIVPGGRAVGWLESDVDQWILQQKRRSERGFKC